MSGAAAGAKLFGGPSARAAQLNSGDSIRAGESDDLPSTVTMLTANDLNANIVLVNKTADPALVASGESVGLVAYDRYTTSAQPSLTGRKAGLLAQGEDFGAWSSSTAGAGLHGESETGVGVWAEATKPAGFALRAVGKVSFNSAGVGRFKRGESAKVVTGVTVPATAKILVTLNQDPGPGNTLKLARRVSATSFEVQLLVAASKATRFSYFVIA
jgi:hypothetical protein